MAKPIANVNSLTDTFEQWLEKTNELCNMSTHNAVTVDNTAVGATVSGNGTVKGILGANTVGVSVISGVGANLTANPSSSNIALISSLHGSNGVVITANTIGVKTGLGGVNSSLLPANLTITTNTVILGTLTVNGFNTDLLIGVQTVNGDVRPAANGAYNLGNTTAVWETVHANNIIVYNGNVTVGNTRVNLNTISVGDSTTNVTVNSTVITIGGPVINTQITASRFSGTSNNSDHLGTLPASDYSTKVYADDKAANAYSNAIAIAANATNLTSGTVNRNRLPQSNTTNTGIVQLVDIPAPFTNTSITHAPTANTIKSLRDYVDSQIVGVGAVTPQFVEDKAANAYANAILYSSNASSLLSGVVPNLRLPKANTTQEGIVQLNDTTSSTSTTQAPTANVARTLALQVANAYSNAVTNTTFQLSTFTGTSNIATVGNITSGTWNGSTIGVARGGTGNTTFSTGAGLIYTIGGTNPLRKATGAEIATAIGSNKVANATYADSAGSATSAGTVPGAGVSGKVANATYADSAGSAGSVPGAGVSGKVANAVFADTAGVALSFSGSVTVANLNFVNSTATTTYSGNSVVTINANTLLSFQPVQQGGGTGQLNNKVYVGWSGTRLKAQVDSTDLGNIVFDNIKIANAGFADAAATATSATNAANATFATNAGTANNSTHVGGLAVHTGRNNEANKIVRTNGDGDLLARYFNSTIGNEGNNSSPPRVWGTNGSDDYLRSYLTSALSVGFAGSAGSAASATVALTANNSTHFNGQTSSFYTDIPARLGFTPIQQGGGSGQGTNKVYIGWANDGSGRLRAQVDVSSWGDFVLTGYSTNQTLQLNRLGLGGLDVSSYNSGTLRCTELYAGSTQINGNISITSGNITGVGTVSGTTASFTTATFTGVGSFGALQVGSATGATTGDIFTSGGNIQLGTGNAGEKRLRLHNNGRNVYFYLAPNDASAGIVGLWDASINANRWYTDNSANFIATGNITAYSDARLKKDIQQISDSLNKVKQLTGYTFTRIDNGIKQTGLLAQDVEKVLPEAVLKDGEYLALAYGNLAGLLVEAIKELSSKIDKIEQRLNT